MKKLKGVLLLLLLIIFTSCGNKENEEKAKILKISSEVELASLDSGVATDEISMEAMACLFEGLYQVDKNGNVIPGMAIKDEVSEDGKIYTMHLRDAKWSNGTEVTANDFVFAWRRLANPATSSEYAYILDVANVKNAEDVMKGKKTIEELGITALDDKTLRVELTTPTPFFKGLMSFSPFYPINEEFYNQYKEQYALSPQAIISNGAFKLKAWNQGSGYELEKNDSYYDADNVKIDGIKMQIVKDAQSGLVAYDQNDLDVVKITGEIIDRYEGDEELTFMSKGYLWYLSPNLEVPELRNVNLRKAIALSYDKKLITENILKDGAIPADFIVPEGLAIGPDGKDFRETSPKYLEFNKELAKEYFEKAKKELKKDSFNFELLFEDSEASKQIAEFIKYELESTLVGMKIELKQQPKKSRLQLMKGGNYQLGLTRWGPDYADPMTYLELWKSDNNYNYGKWSNPYYDELLYNASKGKYVNNLEKRWEKLKEGEKILLDDAVVMPVYQTGVARLIKKNVKGIEYRSVGTPTILKNVTID